MKISKFSLTVAFIILVGILPLYTLYWFHAKESSVVVKEVIVVNVFNDMNESEVFRPDSWNAARLLQAHSVVLAKRSDRILLSHVKYLIAVITTSDRLQVVENRFAGYCQRESCKVQYYPTKNQRYDPSHGVPLDNSLWEPTVQHFGRTDKSKEDPLDKNEEKTDFIFNYRDILLEAAFGCSSPYTDCDGPLVTFDFLVILVDSIFPCFNHLDAALMGHITEFNGNKRDLMLFAAKMSYNKGAHRYFSVQDHEFATAFPLGGTSFLPVIPDSAAPIVISSKLVDSIVRLMPVLSKFSLREDVMLAIWTMPFNKTVIDLAGNQWIGIERATIAPTPAPNIDTGSKKVQRSILADGRWANSVKRSNVSIADTCICSTVNFAWNPNAQFIAHMNCDFVQSPRRRAARVGQLEEAKPPEAIDRFAKCFQHYPKYIC